MELKLHVICPSGVASCSILDYPMKMNLRRQGSRLTRTAGNANGTMPIVTENHNRCAGIAKRYFFGLDARKHYCTLPMPDREVYFFATSRALTSIMVAASENVEIAGFHMDTE